MQSIGPESKHQAGLVAWGSSAKGCGDAQRTSPCDRAWRFEHRVPSDSFCPMGIAKRCKAHLGISNRPSMNQDASARSFRAIDAARLDAARLFLGSELQCSFTRARCWGHVIAVGKGSGALRFVIAM
jgi:hypothetical protein